MIKLSKSELRVLIGVVTGGGGTVSNLASSLGVTPGLISRAVSSLQAGGLVKSEKKGRMKLVELADTGHAAAFMRLLQSRPDASLNWLSGFAIEVLIIAAGEKGVASDWLEKEATCSKATLRKMIYGLRSAGVLAKISGGFEVTEGLARDFANAYADWLQFKDQERFTGYSVSKRIRKHVILRTQTKQVPEWFGKTGMTALIESGLNLTPTSYSDYYYSIDKRKRSLPIEEQLVHAIVLSTLRQHAADRTALSMFLATNRLDYGALTYLTAQYSVQEEYEELRRVNELVKRIQ